MSRARGLGAAGSGTHHWWWQRLTALALVPLTLWFVSVLIAVAGDGNRSLDTWLSQPFPAIGMVALLVFLFWHMALGLQVVAEDYLHHRAVKLAVIAAVQLACLLLAAASITAVILL
ncbi:MAG TPA: succinate dehydrogenase, hydrophobic membrane anchor protein [Arenicellales bacterium]|nr:succinate dehydrogenase, hydrophobic membrane anchor protein [Arenicellales bacterium]